MSPTLLIAQGYFNRALDKWNENPSPENLAALQKWRIEVEYHRREIEKAERK